MQINVIFDASAANAPAGFETAVEAAVSYLDSVIATPLTINIQFGWGEIGGQPMSANALGESEPYGSFMSYSQVRGALTSVATDSDELASVATLGANDPTNGGLFFVAVGEQEALGLLPGNYSGTGGYVGLNSTFSYTFDPNNRAVSGEYDAIGILEHEITEVLGRDADLGEGQSDATNIYSPMDLFRYASAGVRDLTPASGFFSVNGTSLLFDWNNPLNGGDGGDWATSVPDDSFDAFASPGVEEAVSATDLRLLDVLGFHPTAPAPATPPSTPAPSVGGSSPMVETQNTTIAGGQSVYFPFSAPATDVTGYTLSGAVNLIDDGTITVISSATAGGVGVAAATHGGTVQIGSNAALYVEATASGAEATGFEGAAASPNVSNGGLIQVVSTEGSATGFQTSDSSSSVTNASTGTLTVWGDASATGVYFTNGGSFSNAGLIQVTGMTPIGVEGASSFTNSGTIDSTGVDGGAGGAIGVDITAPAVGGPVLSTLTNDGVITSDTAINIDGASFSLSPNVTINNTGRINGAISLADGDDTITNSGAINGPIFFGDGDSTYNGAGGSIIGGGAIYLGFGVNNVTLGNDGETVYGGFDADTITGGSGNDFIEIGGGANTVNGGGGVNVLSFADSVTPVTVNLATGTASDDGTDSIKNIQEVIGTNWAGDVMTAGAAGQTLIAGDGGLTTMNGAAAGGDTFVLGDGVGTTNLGGNGNHVVYGIGDGVQTVGGFNSSDVLTIYGYASAESVTQRGAAVDIQLSEQDSVTLQNTSLSQVNSTDVQYNAGFYPGLALPASLPPWGTNPIFIEQNLTIPSSATISEQGEAYGFVNEGNSLTVNGSVTVDFPTVALSDDVYGWFDNNINEFGVPITSANDTITFGDESTFDVESAEGGAVGFAALYTTSLSVADNMTISAGGEAWGVLAPSSVFNYTSVANNLSHAAVTVEAAGEAIGLALGDGGQISNAGTLTVIGGTVAYGVQIDQAQGQTLTNTGSIAATVGAFTFPGFAAGSADESSDDDDEGVTTGPPNAATVRLPPTPTSDSVTPTTPSGGAAQAGSGQTFGIAVGGLATGGAYAINNSGGISASTAITDYADGGGQLPALNITNSGTIDGAIDLEAAVSSLLNTGAITGAILLQDNGASAAASPGYILNLSGGTYNGQISLEAGSAGNVTMNDTIDTGAGSTVISAAGGESNLDVTVKSLASDPATMEFSIASTQASFVHEENGAWLVNAATDGVFLLTSVKTLQFSDQTIHLAQGPPAPDDFAGQGMSAILFGQTGGTLADWQMDGTAIAGGGTLGNPGGTWAEVGTGDFNGDGKADILFQDASGNVATWEMNGTSIIGGGDIGNPGGAWHVAGVGDFNGAATSDILFADTAGDLAIWEMNGTSIVGGGTIGNPGGSWAVKGVGDFYGTGTSDILFQDGSGSVALWEMNGTGIVGGGVVGNPGGTWQVEGVGDFNGDGKADILFEDAQGDYAIWEMNGTTIIGGGDIGNPGAAWSFAGVGDYTGDGMSDILFHDAAGDLAIWEMNGTSIAGGGDIGNPGSIWHVLG